MTTKKNIILIIASMGVFVEALDIAIINLTIPSIQAQFQVSNDTVQWIQTLYVLLYGGFLIIGGKLTDIIGRKKIFLLGAGLFLLTSLGAGLSSSFEILALSRAIQGFAAALIMPAALAIVSHTFTEKQERSKAIGIFSSFAAVGAGSGLSVGGLISTYWGWHWVFLINVPVLLIVIAIAWFYLKEDPEENIVERVDLFSGLLLIAGLLMLSYGVHQLGELRNQHTTIISCISAAVICIMLLNQRLSRHKNPLIDLKIFNSGTIVTANAAFFTLGSFFSGYLFLIALLLQKDMHFTAAVSGIMLAPFNILSAIVGKFLLPKLTLKMNIERIGILGMAIMLTGGLCMLAGLLMGHSISLILISAACISGTGMAICFTSFSVLSVRDVPPQHYGLASSLANTSYFMGAGIGLSVLTLFLPKTDLTVSVNSFSLGILCIYAIAGLGILVRHIYRSDS
jgi:EmrB/QacA subfamily drug resistance transporter